MKRQLLERDLIAYALIGGPAKGRTLGVAVMECPAACGATLHIHRAPLEKLYGGSLRRRCPNTGIAYRVVPNWNAVELTAPCELTAAVVA